ncbi:MAG TPA: PepSY-associated TM helix domain-containing protein, partial [Chitinophagaceae bacterium]|nr:PepSY-associated TM helix domain-containing protein [Chitinophagaceae bacterium]
LIIWFPQRIRNWKQGLSVKWKAGWKRVNHDLHNSLAFYAVFFLLLMGLTGPQWSFEWYRTGLQKTLGTYKSKDAPKEKTLKSTLLQNDTRPASLSIAGYIQEADRALNYPGNYIITLPGDSVATTGISKTKLGFFAPAAPDRLILDQYSGKVLKLDIFKQKPFNERIAGSIKAIHVGNVYGTFTKIIYFLACLIATSLPVTGTMIWLNKLKKKGRRKNTTIEVNTSNEIAEQVA